MERLEDRSLMTASTLAAIGSNWFGDYLPTGEAAHAGTPSASIADASASAGSAVVGAANNACDWIVQFSAAAMNGLTSASQCSRLLSDSDGVQFQLLEGLGMEGAVLVRSTGATVSTAAALLHADGNIAAFEADTLQQFEKTPNDSSYSQQWAPSDINAPSAWNISTGSSGVVVAVIDTGVDYNNPDLAANIWTNPLGANSGDGFAGDLHGYNFVADDGNVMDDNGHGTHVAGIIGAAGNNGQGISGVNWSVSIMALKFLDANGDGYTSDAVRAVNYMTMMRTECHINIRAANASFDGGNYDAAMSTAIAAAGNAGILFVAAAGNNGTSNDASPQYPANYGAGANGDANVISVAASTASDQLATFSNYGANTVDLAAPGVNIYSTFLGGYATMSGTSMAAPEVTGVAALCWAVDPNATVAQVKAAILDGVDKIAGLAGKVETGGRLDAYNALRLIQADIVNPSPAYPHAQPGRIVRLTWLGSDRRHGDVGRLRRRRVRRLRRRGLLLSGLRRQRRHGTPATG